MATHNDLMPSLVKFDEATHTYLSSTGVELVGTSMLINYLYPNKYKGVPANILAQAAQRGTDIHLACQQSDIFGVIPEDCPYQEVYAYRELVDGAGIKMIASEYLVSDDVSVATMIDCIDDHLNLYDIKTTRTLDLEALSWQLSICAYAFEAQNPALKVGKLYGIHLRGDRAEMRLVDRRSATEVQDLIFNYSVGLPMPSITDGHNVGDLSHIIDIERKIITFSKAVKDLEDVKKQHLEALKVEMENRGLKKIETDRLLVTLVGDSSTTTIDSKALRLEHPDIAEKFTKTSVRKGYVKITLRENGDL